MKNKAVQTSSAQAEFLAAARRAFKRVDRRLRAENEKLGLPLISAKNGRVRLIRLNGARS